MRRCAAGWEVVATSWQGNPCSTCQSVGDTMEHLASSRGGCASSKLKRPLCPLAFIALISGSQIQHVCFVCFADVRVRQSLPARPSKNRFAATHNSPDTALRAFILLLTPMQYKQIKDIWFRSESAQLQDWHLMKKTRQACRRTSFAEFRPSPGFAQIDLGRLLHPPNPLGHLWVVVLVWFILYSPLSLWLLTRSLQVLAKSITYLIKKELLLDIYPHKNVASKLTIPDCYWML